MALWPEKQRIAQAEIDRVIGAERLPLIQDRPHLPYVNALIKEVLRWRPVLPLGMSLLLFPQTAIVIHELQVLHELQRKMTYIKAI